MARSAFEQVIELQLQRFSPEAARLRHIEIARQTLAAFLSRQGIRPAVSIETDGRPAVSELSVKPYGVITYRFGRMREIAAFALAEAERLSPLRSGAYRDAWFAMVGKAEVALADIPAGAIVMITNDEPYHRKIHVGARGFQRYANPGIVEKLRQLVLKKYRPVVDAQIRFVTLAGGYRLRRPARGQPAGREMQYPALVLTPKF